MYLVFSLDGVIVEETKAATKQLTSDLSNKSDRAYLETCGYVCYGLCLNLIQAFSLILRGTRSGRPQPVRQIPAYEV